MGEVATALLPIALFFLLFQVISLKLNGRELVRIGAGLMYTYIGLVLFLAGVNVGFMPMGNYIGQLLAALEARWILVPIGMLIGYYVVAAEPAVHVLSKQVYELSAGSIPKKGVEPEPVHRRIGFGRFGHAAHPDGPAYPVPADSRLRDRAALNDFCTAGFHLHRV